ncbi:N-6 DNA methylase [Clostridioides difficile]|nr:N-6 DNA methylase [Clostridioides difficile]HBG0818209.1 N-6 DNA methylase [Clostridioides difficile]
METNNKSLESWIWDAACAIRGEKDASKFKDYILPLVFLKRLCDVYDDEITRICLELNVNRTNARDMINENKDLVRFYLPLVPQNKEVDSTWQVIRNLTGNIGEELTSILDKIARHNTLLDGIINRVDYNATTHNQRDISDDRLSKLIEKISLKRLGLKDVEPDIIGRSYEYLIRKFAEDSGQSSGEFYTPTEPGIVMAKIMDPKPGEKAHDVTAGSGGLLIKCELNLCEKMKSQGNSTYERLKLYGQEYLPSTWAMANMNMVIHDMEGKIELGDTLANPKFIDENNKLEKFNFVVANPMWNQKGYGKEFFESDEYGRFIYGYPGEHADWLWMQHILACLEDKGRAAVVLGIGSATREKGEMTVRQEFIDNDLIESVIVLPYNLFYNTDAQGVIYIINKNKPQNLKDKVLFINASKYFDKGRPKNYLTNEGIDIIAQIYQKTLEIEGISKIVSRDEIKDEKYNLNPIKYVFELKSLETKDIKELSKEYNKVVYEELNNLIDIDSIFEECGEIEFDTKESIFGEISNKFELVELGKIVEEHKQKAGDQNYEIFSCSKIHGIILQSEKFNHQVASKNTKDYKVVKPGMFAYDPMLLWSGSIGKNNYSIDGIVSKAYVVFKQIDPNINPNYLEYILRSDMMLPFYESISDGTNKRRKKAKFENFKKLLIPIPEKEIQDKIEKLLLEKEIITKKSNLLGSIVDSYFNINLFKK